MNALMPTPMPAVMTRAAAPGEIDLDTCTDAAAMRSLLQRRLPGFANGRLRIDALSVCKVRRNASLRRNPHPITLCYELRVSDIARNRVAMQMLYAKVCRAGLSAACYRQHFDGPLVQPAVGAPLVHLPELDMVIWALPNDPGLPQLARLLDPAQAEGLLPWAALRRSMGWARAELGTVQVRLMRYEPERRATLRYALTRADGTEAHALYAKTFCDARAEIIHHRFEHFWQLSQADADAPLVARPLGHCGTTRTVWQASATGAPLLQSLGTGNPAALAGRVARALALLHAAPPALAVGAVPRSAAHWVAEARRRQRKISRASPALAMRVSGVADAIEAHAGHPIARPTSLIHGDFHPEQIWVDQGRIVLFDFDEFTLGDPMEDLAELTLKLDQAGMAATVGSPLIEAYAACAPHRFDRRSLDWHLTVQSLLQASRAFVFHKPGWADELTRRLAGSEARAASLNRESAR